MTSQAWTDEIEMKAKQFAIITINQPQDGQDMQGSKAMGNQHRAKGYGGISVIH
jgi:hypothetical protein